MLTPIDIVEELFTGKRTTPEEYGATVAYVGGIAVRIDVDGSSAVIVVVDDEYHVIASDGVTVHHRPDDLIAHLGEML